MARRIQPGSGQRTNFTHFMRSLSWKLALLLSILIIAVVAVPIFAYGTHIGSNFMPSITQFFSKLSAPSAPATPTPLPPLSKTLPQPGSILYTVTEGDSCVSILAYEMHMDSSGTIFSDAKPETVKALNDTLGQDCHKLQPGMVLPLSPHYPLIALGGTVQKIESLTPQQLLPTPLIHVQHPDDDDENGLSPAADCSGGCKLTVRLNDQTQVFLSVKTDLPVRVGSWVWAQAMLPRKSVRSFDTYPYADPKLSYNGATLRVCDFQVDDKHDDDSALCQTLNPNTIVTDRGSWLLAVTGSGALDHWGYSLKVPSGTRVLLWLSLDQGKLSYRAGNAAYRYNDTSHVYEKL